MQDTLVALKEAKVEERLASALREVESLKAEVQDLTQVRDLTLTLILTLTLTLIGSNAGERPSIRGERGCIGSQTPR